MVLLYYLIHYSLLFLGFIFSLQYYRRLCLPYLGIKKFILSQKRLYRKYNQQFILIILYIINNFFHAMEDNFNSFILQSKKPLLNSPRYYNQFYRHFKTVFQQKISLGGAIKPTKSSSVYFASQFSNYTKYINLSLYTINRDYIYIII